MNKKSGLFHSFIVSYAFLFFPLNPCSQNTNYYCQHISPKLYFSYHITGRKHCPEYVRAKHVKNSGIQK